MRISLFRGGFANTVSTEVIESWDEFVDLVTMPVEGQKNGDYFTRGFCDGERCDENMAGLDLVIIDGDQLLDNGHTCCPAQMAHEVIKGAGLTHVIYSSYSTDLANNRHKWRLCLPCPDLDGPETLAQAVAEVVTILQAGGCTVRNVRENGVLSQPWFTPRHPPGLQDDFYFAYHDGQEYRLTGRIVDTARYNDSKPDSQKNNDTGHFSWSWALGQIRSGTLHQALKSICGWLVLTTDWADVQLGQYLLEMSQLCPDPEKAKRARETEEIDSLIKYCRQKSGKGGPDTGVATWRDTLITAAEMQGKEYPPLRWAVDGVVPEGLVIVAGDPKAGKSLMAVDVCSAIASGLEAFGTRSCVAGDVVYVSLEDPERRVAERIRQQTDLWPERFKLITGGGIPTLGPDFFKMTDEMVMMWPDLRAIVIDTLQFIIPPKKQNTNDYDHYYQCLHPLHAWAIQNRIAVICITHRTKGQTPDDGNPFAGIVGSVAIQGTADAMLMLRKNHAKKNFDPGLADGFLDVVGREVGQEHYSLDFDQEAMKWAIRSDMRANEVTGNSNWLLITDFLKKRPATPKEISEGLQINISTVSSCLKRMQKKYLVETENGKWQIPGRQYFDSSKW